MARRNDKVITTLEGYAILPAREPNGVFFQHGFHGNFTLPIPVLYKLVQFLENGKTSPGFVEEVRKALRNSRILTVIDGYNVLPSREDNSIFLQSPHGSNFTVKIPVLYKLVQLFETDPSFGQYFR